MRLVRTRPISTAAAAWLAGLLALGCGGDDRTRADDGTATDGQDSGDTDPADTEGDPAVDCAGVGAGLAPMRRMTKTQYDNTVRDLFAGAVEPGPQFPGSVIHDEYTNNPSANVVSLSAAEDILLAAEHVAEQVIDDVGTIVPCDPGPACAQSFIDDFGRRAFRRPLRDEERQALLDAYAQVEGTDGFADGIGTVVGIILQAPQFLYLIESEGAEIEPGVVELTDHELATRLSYLLWDSTPDAQLLELADNGLLHETMQLQAQVERLLADRSRSGPALDRFVREWMRFDGVPSFDKDPTRFPAYDDALASSMDQELSRFIDGVLTSEEPSLRNLLTSSTTEVDETLASFYGVAAPAPGQWATVSLPPEQRPGLLSRPALLAEHSSATSSGPIYRGRLVRSQLLCGELPPPPADAMANTPVYPEDATERERTEILMNHMDCGVCHGLMNPIGLGFEHYDATGAWRELDVDGAAVDARGEILGGTAEVSGEFDGVPQLAERLADAEEVTTCFADQMYRHALGLTSVDVLACAVEPIEQAFVEADGDIPSLMVALVTSNAFRMRVLPADDEGQD